MAGQVTPNLGLIIYPSIEGTYQRELRESYLYNFQKIDEELGGTPKDVYTKEQVDTMLARMSELLLSDADSTALYALVETLMSDGDTITSLGESVVAVDDQATVLIQ